MVDHDNSAEGDREPGEHDAGFRDATGPRRSTWTPPPTSDATSDSESTSDDDLANALAQDLDRVTHPQETHASEADATVSGAEYIAEQGESEPEPEPVATEPEFTTPEPVVPENVRPESVELDEVGPEPIATEVDEPAVDPLAGPEPSTSSLPPTTAPLRRSLPMSELAATLAEQAENPANSGDVMAQLEEQLRLREQDAVEFAKWQESVIATGSPDATDEVERARSDFQDLLPEVPHGETAPPPVGPPVTVPLPPPSFDTSETHTFRMDEVLDSDLISAPAPMSPPMKDIPPPPGHSLTTGRSSAEAMPAEFDDAEADTAGLSVNSASTPIPDLVEPGPAAPAGASPGSFDFDSLLNGAEAPSESENTASNVFDFGESESLRDDDVADTDRAFADGLAPYPVTSEGITTIPDAPSAPVEPVYSRQIPTAVPATGATTAVPAELHAPSAFRVEESSIKPTLEDQRVGKAARLFWLWFAANSSVVSVAFGGAVFSLGMSLRQAIVATLIGVAISFLPLGLGTLAGKWSGQPTMIVSRATFGHLGNILPAIFALVVRVFWGAVLLWFLAAGTSRILVGAELAGPLGESQVTIIGLAVGFLLALVIAYFGYGLIARVQLIFTIISAILIVGLIVITWPAVDIPAALTVGDGPWILVLTGAVLVFSFVGLVWAVSSADLARYQRPGTSGTASMLWSTFGATIPAFTLIAYGAVLAASNPDVATGLLETPLDTIALLIPIWYPVPLIAALALSLLSGVVISIYSAGFALQGTGAKMRRSAAVIIVGVAVAAVAIGITLSVSDFVLVLRDLATSLAVPMAAWAGIFGAEMMIRNRGFNSQSLIQRGGVYPDVNWVNLAMLVVSTVIGFGLTTATVSWLSWQGYLFSIAGVPLTSDLAGSDLGVFAALLLGLLTPIVAGIPSIRRQEQPLVQRSSRLSTPAQ